MKESQIEKTVTKYAKLCGWLSYKFTSPGMRGVTDRIYLRNGQIIFIEYKKEGEIPRKLQAKRIKELKNQGFRVECIDNIEKGIKFFNNFDNYSLHIDNYSLY